MGESSDEDQRSVEVQYIQDSHVSSLNTSIDKSDATRSSLIRPIRTAARAPLSPTIQSNLASDAILTGPNALSTNS
jgi:hypothetical protein